MKGCLNLVKSNLQGNRVKSGKSDEKSTFDYTDISAEI